MADHSELASLATWDVDSMRIMITGASGFAGRHLAARLARHRDVELIGLSSTNRPPIDGGRLLVCDLRDGDLVRRVLERYRPDVIYHLAGQTYVPKAFADPVETLITNVVGQINLLEGCRVAEIDPIFVSVTSAEIYGEVDASDIPITENQAMRPVNPYASSKAAQDLYARQYHVSYGMKIIRARPFNHFGPGQSDRFVVASFARQIAEAEAGIAEPVLLVGNLDPIRDFLDVRDVVRAYEMIAREEFSGDVFNIASGIGVRIGDLLDLLIGMAKCKIEVRQDPERVRPTEVQIFRGDTSRIYRATGWEPEFELVDSARDVLEEWRARVRRNRP